MELGDGVVGCGPEDRSVTELGDGPGGVVGAVGDQAVDTELEQLTCLGERVAQRRRLVADAQMRGQEGVLRPQGPGEDGQLRSVCLLDEGDRPLTGCPSRLSRTRSTLGPMAWA